MAVTERQRHDLLVAVEGVLGEDHAETLMNLLPPVGWADVATKHDLDQQRIVLETRIDALGARLDARIDALDARMDTLVTGERLEAALRQQLGMFITVQAVLFGIVLAIVQLAS